jgi:hypothetical protein
MTFGHAFSWNRLELIVIHPPKQCHLFDGEAQDGQAAVCHPQRMAA